MNEPTELLPCPFCGAGESKIHVNKGTWNGSGYGEPVSVEVRHWCTDVPGQPSRMISRAGRDTASATAAWNTRAKWGQPAHSGEPVYAFRRKGLDDFCTCTEKRYAELSAKPNLFETRIFYTAPQPVEREPLTPERVKEIVLDAGYDQCDIPDSERAAFIDGLRHGEEAHGIKAGRARLEQPCA